MRAMNGPPSSVEQVIERLLIDDEGRACRGIPESACLEEPRNFSIHVASLTLSKSADGLIDPKLVLSWLMTALGAPAYLVGFLVPVREAGVLLPQLFTAVAIRRLAIRKLVWSAGALVQGLAAAAIGIVALSTEGAAAGSAIVALLAVLALARSVCSVSYKDVLGKTVAKSRRGTATGLAGSLSSGAVIVFAGLLTANWIGRFELVVAGLFVAGGAWIAGAALFAALGERRGASEGGKAAISAALENISLLKTDGQLRLFIAARACLTATALAPPFMVAAANTPGGAAFGELGLLVFASAAAALLSAFVWGRLSDRSSRKVLAFAGLAATAALGATATAGFAGVLDGAFALPILLFMLMIAYQGVRLGRSTHLVDMASEATRAAYTALSNTIIGVVLLAGGAFGGLAAVAGPETTLLAMAGLSALGAGAAWRLEEVQKPD